MFLYGVSYTSSVHYTTAPFDKDIKAAVLAVQHSERYNCNDRNGFYKVRLHGTQVLYKKNSMMTKILLLNFIVCYP